MSAQTSHGWVPRGDFAARLVLTRREAGLTVREAADKCGVHYATWSTWERGRLPSDMAGVVRRVSDSLGVDKNWLMWGGGFGDGRPAWAGLGEGKPTSVSELASTRMATAADSAAKARLVSAIDEECTVRDSNPEPAGFTLPAGHRSPGGLVLLGSRVLSIVQTPDPGPRPTSRTRPRAIGRTCHTPGAA
jgi:transcriptional regulator with XRE-family HTH domain